MLAMVLEAPGTPLRPLDLPRPAPGPEQVLIAVEACGVCRTDLHICDGELTEPALPLIPGHEIVGRVVETGARVERYKAGDRVGVPWLGWTCDCCSFCASGRENLCDDARFTGYQINGGYAEMALADQRYCFPVWEHEPAASIAPLLCAGLIGYRSLRIALESTANRCGKLGLYGFGAAAHIVAQVARWQRRDVFAFTSRGDAEAQNFALSLGCAWAGDSTQEPPEPLDAAIIFAPVGSLVPAALKATVKGGTVVCAGIHMSDIPSFPYRILWEERVVRSVANLTRRDAEEFLALAPKVPVHTETEIFPLAAANEALARLRAGDVRGAAVLVPDTSP